MAKDTKKTTENIGETVAKSKASPAELKFNSDELKSSYVNFCNGNCTREEVVLNFGENNTWERTDGIVDINLTHRIVLSPFAAKRLNELLQQLMAEYETNYGILSK